MRKEKRSMIMSLLKIKKPLVSEEVAKNIIRDE